MARHCIIYCYHVAALFYQDNTTPVLLVLFSRNGDI